MTNQRMKNDRETENRREAADKTLNDNRKKNDALTKERRFKADKTLNDNRDRNDEKTIKRREVKDGNFWSYMGTAVLVLIMLGIGAYFLFI